MKAQIVIDLGFGDSGKGLCVDYLVSREDDRPLVVRFSGGHQVGHTVQLGEHRHTFCNFGSGTLRGAPTYYSEYCTIFPPAMYAEASKLAPIIPRVFVHPLCQVTTPYDIAFNRVAERKNQHGSCGVGFGATIERNRNGVTLFAQDFCSDWVFAHKLKSIHHYYKENLKQDAQGLAAFEKELEFFSETSFMAACNDARSLFEITQLSSLLPDHGRLVFEGSQGIMLDQIHGIYPHVTPSYTTSKNAIELILNSQRVDGSISNDIEIYYVSRCYQTRHGNGPISNAEVVELINNREEANVYNDFQGEFRCTELDIELLNYSLITDSSYLSSLNLKKTMVLTCLDQRPDFRWEFLKNLMMRHKISCLLGSYGPSAENIEILSK